MQKLILNYPGSCIFYSSFPFPIDPSELENPSNVFDYESEEE